METGGSTEFARQGRLVLVRKTRGDGQV